MNISCFCLCRIPSYINRPISFWETTHPSPQFRWLAQSLIFNQGRGEEGSEAWPIRVSCLLTIMTGLGRHMIQTGSNFRMFAGSHASHSLSFEAANLINSKVGVASSFFAIILTACLRQCQYNGKQNLEREKNIFLVLFEYLDLAMLKLSSILELSIYLCEAKIHSFCFSQFELGFCLLQLKES